MSPILVVEDNEINAEILTTLLDSLGIPNELAVDGLDSLEKCTSKPKDYYSLILMDIHMPRMNGYEAARKIKTELAMKAPIIAQTATHTTEESIKEHKHYINDYIYKPFRPDQLFELISKYLETDSILNT
ncbi:MAG TPA: response regulator [Treponemataceae bacterium]|nr:response regulator [Treponemataceae bacterium]